MLPLTGSLGKSHLPPARDTCVLQACVSKPFTFLGPRSATRKQRPRAWTASPKPCPRGSRPSGLPSPSPCTRAGLSGPLRVLQSPIPIFLLLPGLRTGPGDLVNPPPPGLGTEHLHSDRATAWRAPWEQARGPGREPVVTLGAEECGAGPAWLTCDPFVKKKEQVGFLFPVRLWGCRDRGTSPPTPPRGGGGGRASSGFSRPLFPEGGC